MIYDDENRGRVWEPDPQQAAAMERRQRKQFSHVGMAAAAFMLITLAAQVVVMVLVMLLDSLLGDFIDFYGFSGRMLMSSLPMYLVAFPVVAGLFKLVPKCGSPQKEQWGFWKFASFFVIAVGIGLAGNILGRLVGLLQPSGPDSAELDQLIRNSPLWWRSFFSGRWLWTGCWDMDRKRPSSCQVLCSAWPTAIFPSSFMPLA